MARTPSSMVLPLGAMAPEFSLRDTRGQLISRGDYVGRVLVVMFICNHCPYVQHIEAGLIAFARDYQPKGVAVVAINANDTEAFPQDGMQAMAERVEQAGYSFAYLLDDTQAVAHAYHAACTPDFFVFDGHHKLVYRGQFDGARPNSEVPVTGADLRQATDAALQHAPPLSVQKPSIGCNIKWKPGHAPQAPSPTPT
jgi:thiol-disulfide isomerase/thioredoxin